VKGHTLDATTATILTIIMADANNNNNKHKQQQKKQSHRDTYATRRARDNCWTSSKLSRLADPVTPSSVMKEQMQSMIAKNTILVVLQK
jgi:hypothetical protein